MMETCRAEGIAWVPFFPLGGTLAGVPNVVDDPAVRAAAAEGGVTPSQIGLAWLLHHAPNILLIPGTATVGHLEENMAAGRIPAEAVAALDRLPAS